MVLTTDYSATGKIVPKVFRMPERVGVEVIEYDPANIKTQRNLQNRQSHGKKELIKEDEHGFFVYSESQHDLAVHFLAKAKAGVPSEEAVPEVIIARFANEQYLVDGHHRLSGLALARELATNDEYIEQYELQGVDVVGFLQKIKVEYWTVESEYELKILADRSNSNAQHGRRLTNAELASMIDTILRDPLKVQFSDMAIAVNFLNYPGARGSIQRARTKLVKAGEIEKVAKTIDINGTPRKAVRPGAQRIRLLQAGIENLENAMEAYTENPANGALMTLGERAGEWKHSWKQAAEYLNDEERKEVTDWLEKLYANVEGVESPLAPAAGETVETPEEVAANAETPVANEQDTTPNEPANESGEKGEGDGNDADADKEALNQVQNAAAGIQTQPNTPPAEQTEADRVAAVIESLADAVSDITDAFKKLGETDMSESHAEKLKEIAGNLDDMIEEFTDELANLEEGEAQQ